MNVSKSFLGMRGWEADLTSISIHTFFLFWSPSIPHKHGSRSWPKRAWQLQRASNVDAGWARNKCAHQSFLIRKTLFAEAQSQTAWISAHNKMAKHMNPSCLIVATVGILWGPLLGHHNASATAVVEADDDAADLTSCMSDTTCVLAFSAHQSWVFRRTLSFRKSCV